MTACTTTAAHYRAGVDSDGNTFINTPFGRATYLEYYADGQRIEGWPLVQFGDDLGTEADVHTTIRALSAFLDDVDPSGRNRLATTGGVS